MMYGKLFESAFTGSMMGAGADVFAVWAYVIANAKDGHVELNPKHLAALIGADVERMEKAITFLCEPDPYSRTQAKEGRRLVRDGQFQYVVVNHDLYRQIASSEEKKAYDRRWVAEKREKEKANKIKTVPPKNTTSRKMSLSVVNARISDTDTDTDTDTEALKPLSGKPDAFDLFWKAYPRKDAKKNARKVFAKLNPSKELFEKMLVRLEVYKASAGWKKDGGQFIPLPTSWLNGKRWEDEGVEGARDGLTEFVESEKRKEAQNATQ